MRRTATVKHLHLDRGKSTSVSKTERLLRGAGALAKGRRPGRSWLSHELRKTQSVNTVKIEGLLWERTYANSLDSRVRRRNEAKDHQHDVGELLLPRARARLVVQHRVVDVAKGHTMYIARQSALGAEVTRDDMCDTHHAKLPMNETNLSRSAAPK